MNTFGWSSSRLQARLVLLVSVLGLVMGLHAVVPSGARAMDGLCHAGGVSCDDDGGDSTGFGGNGDYDDGSGWVDGGGYDDGGGYGDGSGSSDGSGYGDGGGDSGDGGGDYGDGGDTAGTGGGQGDAGSDAGDPLWGDSSDPTGWGDPNDSVGSGVGSSGWDDPMDPTGWAGTDPAGDRVIDQPITIPDDWGEVIRIPNAMPMDEPGVDPNACKKERRDFLLAPQGDDENDAHQRLLMCDWDHRNDKYILTRVDPSAGHGTTGATAATVATLQAIAAGKQLHAAAAQARAATQAAMKAAAKAGQQAGRSSARRSPAKPIAAGGHHARKRRG
jgi:hypothetical protein